MPPCRSARGKGKEKLSDDEPMEDPPYVAWMKEQQKQGKPSPTIAKAKCDSAGASTSSGPGHDYDETGGDTDVSDDELEEIVSESDSDADSDNYKAGSDDEEEDSDGAKVGSGDDRSTRRSKKEKRPSAKRNKRQWSDAELTSLAAARWNTKDDLKAMQGKQGSQYWKKLRAHMVERDATWNRDEGQMSNAWKRLEKKLQDSTQLLVAAMAGLRQQMASPPVPPAAPATTPPPAPPADASNANMAGSEDVAEQHEP
ncbi:unnamed protein product [Closterium sp. Naga37s-1]|nr:unnamed protein product [Closterium sp. Naga37s-1]